jgi:2,4-dienoyl-CoA reductase-like NADH-dependent reductase (Old Yellow Enzyme family)/thioredoxin reductase
MGNRLVKLFEPIQINSMRLKNRLVMPAMVTNFADGQGMVTPRQIVHYGERARYGVGMITIECTSVSMTGRASDHQLGAYKDDFIPGLKKLAEAIKEHGCKCVLQLHHAGRRAASKFNHGSAPVAPSPIPCVDGEVPEELTVDQIERITEEFGDAALRAKKAGFDGVELHGGHGYLINQFLSPLSNHRTDKYGGTFENRMRFVREIISCARDKVGRDYPILIKLSVDEYLTGGLGVKDTSIIARILQDASVDAIIASAGHTGAAVQGPPRATPGAYCSRACHVHLADSIKKMVNIPVAAIGRINDPILGESILREKKADLICMGRPLLADPELPLKALERRFEDIRTCIACNMCHKTLQETNLGCAVNAALGREETYRIVPVQKPKKVFVVGGGPAGMEAARVASLRGHKVFLYEKQDQLGGQLLLAAIPPHKDEIPYLIRYLLTQLRKLRVGIEVSKEVNPETVEQLRPDAVILATGSVPLVPEIPGVVGKNVVLAGDVLTEKVELREKNGAIIIIGGGIVGCETAEFLANKGKKVTIIEMLSEIAQVFEKRERSYLKERLAQHGVTILTGVRVERITDRGAILEDGNEIMAETVVLAAGGKVDDMLMESLKGKVPEIYAIGDCVGPRMIMDAIREGAAVGHKI